MWQVLSVGSHKAEIQMLVGACVPVRGSGSTSTLTGYR